MGADAFRRILVTTTVVAVWNVAGALAQSPVPGQAAATAPSVPAAGPPATNGGVQQAGFWDWLPKPQITMPEIKMPQITMPKIEMPTWKSGGQASDGGVFAPVKASAGKISSGAKKAWEGARELFGMARGSTAASAPRVASQQQPSTWQRMFGSGAQDQGPQTIGEFMSGSRPR